MAHQDCVEPVRELQGRQDVQVCFGIRHHGAVHEERLFVGGFTEFQVDLPCHGLYPVDDGRGTLGNLDAFHPGAGHPGQPEGGGKAPHYRPVLVQHLRIHTGKAQKAYLPCSGGSIGITDCHACRVLEALGQVAAGHFHQPGRRNDFRPEFLHPGNRVTLRTRRGDCGIQRVYLLRMGGK